MLIVGMIMFVASTCLADMATFNAGNGTVYDTSISGRPSNQNWDYSYDSYLYTGLLASTNDEMRSLVAFDVSSLAGKSINSAQLRMRVLDGGNPTIFNLATVTIGIYEILPANAGWQQNLAMSTSPTVGHYVTWNYKNQVAFDGGPYTGSTPWAGSAGLSTAGVDYNPTPLFTFQTDLTKVYGYLTVDLPVALIDQWVTGANAGLIIKCSPLPANDWAFMMSSRTGADNGPNLFVDYHTGPNVLADCNAVWAAGQGMEADLNKDCKVDMKDLYTVATSWLACDKPIQCGCPSLPSVGLSTYYASAAPSGMSIDGNLNEWPAFDYTDSGWCTSKWVKLAKTYYGTPSDVNNAYMCVMYSATQNVIYAAIIADDYNPVYWDGLNAYSSEGQDDIEVFIQGNRSNSSPQNPLGIWTNAQHMVVGLNSDLVTTWARWATGVAFGDYAGPPQEIGSPGLEAKVSRTHIGNYDHVVYELKLIPYDYYGGLEAMPNVITDLSSGSRLGFDITLGTKASSSFGMLCPNDFEGKYQNVNQYSLLICE
jgi:hypothetical protein